MLAGLQGSGKTTLAGKLGRWLKAQGHTPLLVAADLQRPNAVNQLSIVAGQAGVDVFAPEPGNGVGDPVQVAARLDRARPPHHARRRRRRHRRPARHRRRADGAGRRHPRRRPARRDAVRRRRDDRPGRRHHGDRVPGGRRLLRRRPHQARRRRPRWRRAVGALRDRPADHVRLHRREARPTSTSSTPSGWPRASSAWATCSPSSSRPSSTSTPTRPSGWPASSPPARASRSRTSSSR